MGIPDYIMYYIFSRQDFVERSWPVRREAAIAMLAVRPPRDKFMCGVWFDQLSDEARYELSRRCAQLAAFSGHIVHGEFVDEDAPDDELNNVLGMWYDERFFGPVDWRQVVDLVANEALGVEEMML